MGDREDDGAVARRDNFPAGYFRGRGGLIQNANANRPARVGANHLPPNFGDLSPRDQFQERKGLFFRLYRGRSHLRRPDLEAMRLMSRVSFRFNAFGHVPGIEIGDRFDFRAEMHVVGLHRAPEAGIASVAVGNESFASSIVISGGYMDDVDRGQEIVYTGHGGNNDERNARRRVDQNDGGGNRALLNSKEYQRPVRVIRRSGTGRNKQAILADEVGNNARKRYSYDGLYTVMDHVYEEGFHGRRVHKFTLRRNADQAPLPNRMNRRGV